MARLNRRKRMARTVHCARFVAPFLLFFFLFAADSFILPAVAQSEAVKKFREEWEKSKDFPENQKEAIENLAREYSLEAVKEILNVAFSESVSYQASDAAYAALLRMQTAEIIEYLTKEVTSHNDWRVRAVVARLLGEYRNRSVVSGLLGALADKKWEVRLGAAKALRNYRLRDVIEPLIEAMQKESGTLIDEMSQTLRIITGEALDEPADWKNWWNSKKATFQVPEEGKEGSETAGSGKSPEVRTVAPSPIYGQIKSKNVIFVIDTSRSMSIEGLWGEDRKKMSRLEIVKIELKKVLDTQIGKDCMFNIITFAQEVKPWKTQPVKGSRENIDSAKKFVDSLKPEGLTYTYGALMESLNNRDADTIYFLSDGEPTYPPDKVDEVDRPSILGKMRSLNRFRNVTIHAIAFLVGEGKDFQIDENKTLCAEFMEKLASETHGSYKKIE
jgi:hypothetical protein